MYIVLAKPSWRRWLPHFVRRAIVLLFARAGRSIAAKMAMMAITTSNSISVNAKSDDSVCRFFIFPDKAIL